MAKTLLKNLKQVLIGTCTVDGTMPTTTTKIGIITDEGVTFNEGDPTIENLKEARNPYPIGQNVTFADVSFTFPMMITDEEDIATIKGGTVATGSWKPGANFSLIEKAVIIETPTSTMKVSIPRAAITGKFSGKLADSGQILLDVTITPLDSGFDGIAPYTISF